MSDSRIVSPRSSNGRLSSRHAEAVYSSHREDRGRSRHSIISSRIVSPRSSNGRPSSRNVEVRSSSHREEHGRSRHNRAGTSSVRDVRGTSRNDRVGTPSRHDDCTRSIQSRAGHSGRPEGRSKVEHSRAGEGRRSSKHSRAENSRRPESNARSRHGEAGSSHQRERYQPNGHGEAGSSSRQERHSRSNHSKASPTSHHEGKAHHSQPEKVDHSLHKQLLRIAELAVRSKTDAKRRGDTQGALDTIREAYVMTREWADRAFEELQSNGRNPRRHHHRSDKDKRSLATFGKLARMRWRLSWARGARRNELKLDMLQEIYDILLAHIRDAKHEMRRLEYKLGLRERKKNRSHKHRSQ